MDFTKFRSRAQAALDPLVWEYFEAVADSQDLPRVDEMQWQRVDVVPRVLRGTASVDTSVDLPGADGLSTPLFIAPTAGHGLADPRAEAAAAEAAACNGALMIYSHSATLSTEQFGAAATGAWWAQLYLLQDRGLTREYVAGARRYGAGAIVLTVDGGGPVGGAPFRSGVQARLGATAGNFPGMTWPQMTAGYAHGLSTDDVCRVVEWAGIPVYVKGVLNPDDANGAVDAGACGVIVSNHGRRQVGHVVPVARALPRIVDAVADRVPVLVDGGIRSGLDALRALALGASAVGVGRPVLWGLAASGTDGVAAVLWTLTAELRWAMSASSVARVADINRDLVDLAGNQPISGIPG